MTFLPEEGRRGRVWITLVPLIDLSLLIVLLYSASMQKPLSHEAMKELNEPSISSQLYASSSCPSLESTQAGEAIHAE
jgi:hypothetical protein